MGASFTSSTVEVVTIDHRPASRRPGPTKNRPAKLTGSLDYRPLQILDVSLGPNSDRDLLREQRGTGSTSARRTSAATTCA